MDADEARSRFSAARVARMATAAFSAQPHMVVICFALDGETLYTAIDHKPKSTARLRRLDNLSMNPRVSLLVDHYDDADWSALWWVRADGAARELEPDDPLAERGVELLVDRYEQYRRQPPEGPVVAIDVERWVGWEAGA